MKSVKQPAAAHRDNKRAHLFLITSNPGLARKGNTVQNTNQNLCSIVVLDDGETWSRFGQVLTITENAYTRLLEGAEIRDLAGSDIVKTSPI